MAITFGNTTNADGASVAHNNNGNFLLVATNNTADTVSGVTFNSVSMTQIGTSQFNTATSRYLTLWGLVAPSSGSYNIVITGGGSPQNRAVSCLGVHQTTPYTNITTNGSTSTSATVTLTTSATGSFIIGAVATNKTLTAGADTSDVVSDFFGIFRSTNAVNSASGTLTVSLASSAEWVFKGISLDPIPASGPSNLKSLDTNVKANIKSYNTNLIANVKSINTNS